MGDIQVHKGPLKLCDYKWSLKNWDGKLLATQFFMISSNGKAKDKQGCCMGRYSIVRDMVMMQGKDCNHVYKREKGGTYMLTRMETGLLGKLQVTIVITSFNTRIGMMAKPSKTKQ